jgi:hypothetical protein
MVDVSEADPLLEKLVVVQLVQVFSASEGKMGPLS